MNPISLQRQIRNNSTDLLNFCEELKQWGAEMKRKDETLKGGSESTESDVPLPRNKVRKTSDPPKPKVEKEKPKTKSKRIKSSDYSSWEKYDVDAECTKLDREKTEGYDSGELTDEYDENAVDDAMYEKEKGNKFVKHQRWDDAIECYTKAINCYGYDPIFYANRALCYLKKLNYRGAETDCTIALNLDKTYVKAYQRRAAAREALNQLTEAHGDLLKVFDYEPNNKESKAALVKLEKKLETFNQEACTKQPDAQRPKSKFTISRQERKELKSNLNQAISSCESQSNTKECTLQSQGTNLSPSKSIKTEEVAKITTTYWPSGNEIELVETVHKPPHLRSKKPLKRVNIIDTDTLQFVETSKIETAPTESIIKIQEVAQAWPKPNHNSHTIKCDDLKIVERKQNSGKRENQEIKNDSKFKKERSNKIMSDIKENVSNEVKETNEFNFSVPETSVQFNSDWRLLKDKAEWRFLYLKQVNPKKFATIFKESLDCEVFSGIIRTLAEMFVEKNLSVYEFLLRLCEVKRFSMLAMFMSEDDKKDLLKLVDYMRSDNSLSEADIDSLMQKYGF